MANLLNNLFSVLETVGQIRLDDPEIEKSQSYPSLVAKLATNVFAACKDHLAAYVLGRALYSTAEQSTAYLPESPFIPWPATAIIGREALVPLVTYIRLSRSLEAHGRGGAITRRLLQNVAQPPHRLVLLTSRKSSAHAGAIKRIVLPESCHEGLTAAFQKASRSVGEQLLSIADDDLPASAHGLEVHTEAIATEELPREPDDLSAALVKVWLTCANLKCYWLCGDPFLPPSYRWGGLYFLASEEPRADRIILTGLLSREIFLRAHLVEQLRAVARAQEQARRLAIFEKVAPDINALLATLRSAEALTQKLRRGLDPPPHAVVQGYAVPRRFIPDQKQTFFQRWDFQHGWQPAEIARSWDAFVAQVACVLLQFLGDRLPFSDNDTWSGDHPVQRLRFGELDLIERLSGYELKRLKEAQPQAEGAARLFTFLKLCFQSPHKVDPAGKLTAPLLLLWAVEHGFDAGAAEAMVRDTLDDPPQTPTVLLAALEGLRQEVARNDGRCELKLRLYERELQVGFAPLTPELSTAIQNATGSEGSLMSALAMFRDQGIAPAIDHDTVWVSLPRK